MWCAEIVRQLGAKAQEIPAGLAGGGIRPQGVTVVGREREVATSCQVVVFVAGNCEGLRSCVGQLGSRSTDLLPGCQSQKGVSRP